MEVTMKKKPLQLTAMLLSSLLMFGACGGGTDSEQLSDENPSGGTAFAAKEYLGEKEIGENKVNVYGKKLVGDSYKTVGFEETENLCADNEGMGWLILEEPLKGGLPSLGYKGVFPEVKGVSLSTGWSVFEEEPGKYDWTVMDETIEYWVKQGKTINLRLCTDSLTLNQGVVNGCPAWLFEEPYNVPKIINDGQIYADLSNAVYQRELKKFLAEFSGHYTSADYPYRDAIEVVELRGYGMVGEWHSGWYTYTSVESRVEALREIIDLWKEAWGDTLLVVSCTYEFLSTMWGVLNPPTYEDFMHNMGYDHALEVGGISFRRDGIAFALQEYDSRMALDYFYMNTGLPLFGEIGDGYHKHGDNDPYPLFEAMNEALHKWRVNYQSVIGWVAQDFDVVVKKEAELVEYFNRMMGYRFVPDQMQYSSKVKAGDKLYLNSLWSNQAMGRCWKDYDLSVYLENAEGEIVYKGTDKRFNPVSINGGEPHFFDLSYDLPADLSAGTYTLKFAITDEKGDPKIEMPIAGNDGTGKYYLGEVTVGDTAARDLSGVDKIDGTKSYTALGEGKITDRLVNVDGSKALVGGGDSAFAYGQKLENGKTYYVSFDYKTNKPKEDIHITDDSRYVVGAYSLKDRAWSDSYEWLDVSNNVSHRSVTITVPNDGKEYRLGFGGKNGAAQIAIDNVSVKEADAISASFRINPDYTEKTGEGEYEIRSTLTQNYADGLQLRERLDSHSTYMLTFDAATTAEISNGGMFYVMLSDSKADMTDRKGAVDTFSLNRIGSWWTPQDRGYNRYSYVFNTGDYTDDINLVFGIYNMGGVSIRNISLTRMNTDYSYTADAQEIEHNVVPDKGIDVDKNGVVENFEAGVFNGGCMFPGDMSTGIIRRDRYVISGNYSCYIMNTDSAAGDKYQFNNFCRTNLADMRFTPNTTYRVRFKYMVLEDVKPEENGYFYCFAREDGTFAHDRGAYEWRDGYEVGEVYSVEYEFTVGESPNYYFVWGVRRHGGIAIDDVTFEKTEKQGSTSVTISNLKVTKGHAYTVTQDVLYRN